MPVILIAAAKINDPEACIAIDAANEDGYTSVRIGVIGIGRIGRVAPFARTTWFRQRG